MKIVIGIDFDNTIVNYNNVFYKYALMEGLITGQIHKTKKEIRDYIRLFKSDEAWTSLQGQVYSKHMQEAEPAEGVENFFCKCKEHSVKFLIISHKTLYPVIGPLVNLHHVAMNWLADRNFFDRYGLKEAEVIFKETREEKLNAIDTLNCTHFIDDMLEVLIHNKFPLHTQKILYSSEERLDTYSDVRQFGSWKEIEAYFFKQ